MMLYVADFFGSSLGIVVRVIRWVAEGWIGKETTAPCDLVNFVYCISRYSSIHWDGLGFLAPAVGV